MIAALLLAFAPPVAPVETGDPLISEGEVAETCAWPSVVSVRSGGGICSGVLVHPRVVLYAAHCGTANKAPTFSEQGHADPPLRIEDVECEVNPDYDDPLEQHSDFAYCLLGEPVEIAPTPVASDCELASIEAGDEIVIVGFGTNIDEDPFGTKRWATTTVNWIDVEGGELSLGGDGQPSVCAGDSGGPALLRLPDGTWRTIALASTLQDGECGKKATFALARNAGPFVLDDTGIDIEPCRDDSQVWDPGPDCSDFFAAEPGEGSGDWSRVGAWCVGTPVADPQDACATDETGSTGEGAESESGISEGEPEFDDESGSGCACRYGGGGSPLPFVFVLLVRRRQQSQASKAISTQSTSHSTSQQ